MLGASAERRFSIHHTFHDSETIPATMNPGEQLTIQFNGESCRLPHGSTVADALLRFSLQDRPVAVELNREVLPRERRQQQLLHEGDALEVVSLIGGG